MAIIDRYIIENEEIKNINKQNYNIKIATVIVQSSEIKHSSNRNWTLLLDNIISEIGKVADIIILPAGFYIVKCKPKYSYKLIERHIKRILNKRNINSTICLGIDARNDKDQIGLAINKNGIISIARKFYPTDEETQYIELADNYLSLENGHIRIFKVKGYTFYLAVCYDGFGIRKLNLKNPNVNGIINLVHGFYPRGYPGSGEVYFAKYSFAGSSKQWKCPTFGTATFYKRDIPTNWPTGVVWNNEDKNLQEWKYIDNGINSEEQQFEVISNGEKALIKIYYF